MKFKILIAFIFCISCTQTGKNLGTKKVFSSKGFAYVYTDKDYKDKTIKQKLDYNSILASHNKLKLGSLIRIINPKTNESIVLQVNRKILYPEFYKILITSSVAVKLNLDLKLPIVEIEEVKKNKSFIAKKTKIFKEEKQIHSNAPVESVTINNISKAKK